jgi:GntR family transcriptional regulator, transcriptional repressor for pyruvate dehydrogenase complex
MSRPKREKVSASPTTTTRGIQAALLAEILRGDRVPGERLPGERELAQRYRANRTTLRAAISMLEQAKLVTVRAGQGATVADFRNTGTIELLPTFLEQGTDAAEKIHVLEDLLPARLRLLEFATTLAARRASRLDFERLEDITSLLVSVFGTDDTTVLALGEQRWLNAIVDATHSVAVRWIANPLIEVSRVVLERFSAFWVFEKNYPTYLQTYLRMLRAGDDKGALRATRAYFGRADAQVSKRLKQLLTGTAATSQRG